jgi:hypothetical protein
VKFNSITLTPETIQAARQWFADEADACYREAEDGTAPLASHYSLETYRAQMDILKQYALTGCLDHTLTFLQRAHYIQTGESIALLP